MMNMYLAGIGWVSDKPAGNRLRWTYPVSALDAGGNYLGLPSRIVVERAPVTNQDLFRTRGSTASFPFSWWDALPDHTLNPFTLAEAYKLPAPVQAVHFRYQSGPQLRVIASDSSTDTVYADRVVESGGEFYVEAPTIDHLLLVGASGRVTDFRVLDLFRDRDLDWERIAVVQAADTPGMSFQAAATRMDGVVTIGSAEWADIVSAAQQAQLSQTANAPANRPTAWQAYQMLLRLRWELAVLSGFGFFDGPRSQPPSQDETGDLLSGVPPVSMAYRAFEPEGRAGRSNIVICPPHQANPLPAPPVPVYENPEVRMEGSQRFVASLTFRWQQFDPRAIGVEVEEEVSASAAMGTLASSDRFETRPPRVKGGDLDNSLARSFEVPFHDVRLRSRARAVDAWDRNSPFSPWTPQTPLVLRHTVTPPGLVSASHSGGMARLTRNAAWQPDIVVQKASGQVIVYRQIGSPRVETFTATAPVPLGDGSYKTSLTGVANAADFRGGRIVAGRFKASIASISATELIFRLPDNGTGSATLFLPGKVTLQEDRKSLRIWQAVASFPAVGLPSELVFSDSPSGSGNLDYCLRVSFLGRTGPGSNIVTVLRRPGSLIIPPPFVVEFLGRDFYQRALVRIEFTSPVSNGNYTVWWADGWVHADQFDRRAVPGDYTNQPVQDQSLYDLLSFPRNQNIERRVTIGVQRVGDSGAQSGFEVVQVVLPPQV
jgi:hypothetical protein